MKNSTLTNPRKILPSGSRTSQPPRARTGGPCKANTTKIECPREATGISQGRQRFAGTANTSAAATRGTSINASAMLALQLREMLGAHRIELTADVVDDDAHHEHAGEQIEQHADLDEERHGFEQ